MSNEDWRQPGSGEEHLDNDSGGKIDEFYLVIIVICVVITCFICIASAGSGGG